MVKMAGSNQGASSAYTEAGPPEMMIALRKERPIIVILMIRAFVLDGEGHQDARHIKATYAAHL